MIQPDAHLFRIVDCGLRITKPDFDNPKSEIRNPKS